MLRTARLEDKSELKALWKLCFDEETEFLDWFFDERFIPQYCSVCERDGKIIGCAHSIQFNIRLRGHILPCAIICGVSTHPDYRRQGIGGEVMRHLMRLLRSYGVAVVPHRPVKLNTYFSIGHFPVSNSMYVEEDAAHPLGAPGKVELIDISANYDLLYICYLRFIERYSGIIQRSYADFVFKCKDYLSCGAKCLLYQSENGPEGYCIYFDYPDSLSGEELAANSEQAYQSLYEAARYYSFGKAYSLRAASDAPQPENGASFSIIPRGVMGLADVSLLLSVLGLKGASIEVYDSVIPENCGVFDLSGVKTDNAPQLRIEAGRLMQWAVGYRSISDIVTSGEAELLDETILSAMNVLRPCPCFIFDEY